MNTHARVKTIARIAKGLKCQIKDLLLPTPKNGKARKGARAAGKAAAR